MSIPTKGHIAFAVCTIVTMERSDDAPHESPCAIYQVHTVEFPNDGAGEFIQYLVNYPKAIQVYKV